MNSRIITDSETKKLLSDNKFIAAVKNIFLIQKNEWADLNYNYSLLADVKTKTFHFNGFRIKTQFNPNRLTSTSAKTDSVSIQNRKCFLCSNYLPAEQRGFLIDNNLLLLINPFPIFPLHLTIAHTKHVKQEILPYFDLFADCTKKIGGDFTLLYNGPKCGASAPDHLHFQAGTRNTLPIDDDFHQLKNEYGQTLLKNNLIEVTAIDDTLRKFISIETNDSRVLNHTFSLVYQILLGEPVSEEEPKMNIISNYEDNFGWRLIIMLRSKHRPDIYFAQDVNKLLFSPAVVDAGGLCITPMEKDFNRLNENLLKEIFNEVFIDKKLFNIITDKLSTQLSYDSFND